MILRRYFHHKPGRNGIEQAHQKRCREIAEMGKKKQGKGNRADKTSDIVEAEYRGERYPEIMAVILDNPGKERDFRADQRADDDHLSVHHHGVRRDVKMCEEKDKRAGTAGEPDQELYRDEPVKKAPSHEP